MTNRVSIEVILSELLELDLALVKQKLSNNKLRDALIQELMNGNYVAIPGIGKFTAELLNPGEFYDTNLRRYKPVPARLSPRFKLSDRFKRELKKLRTNNIDYY